jgi:hypothetical protein
MFCSQVFDKLWHNVESKSESENALREKYRYEKIKREKRGKEKKTGRNGINKTISFPQVVK